MGAVGGDLSLVPAVGGVVLEHVDHVVKRDKGVVHGDNLEYKPHSDSKCSKYGPPGYQFPVSRLNLGDKKSHPYVDTLVHGGPQDESADSAEAIDANLCHLEVQVVMIYKDKQSRER